MGQKLDKKAKYKKKASGLNEIMEKSCTCSPCYQSMGCSAYKYELCIWHPKNNPYKKNKAMNENLPQSQNLPETPPKNYTTEERIEICNQFKAWYVREYGRLTNKAYLFAGMLEVALRGK